MNGVRLIKRRWQGHGIDWHERLDADLLCGNRGEADAALRGWRRRDQKDQPASVFFHERAQCLQSADRLSLRVRPERNVLSRPDECEEIVGIWNDVAEHLRSEDATHVPERAPVGQ